VLKFLTIRVEEEEELLEVASGKAESSGGGV